MASKHPGVEGGDNEKAVAAGKLRKFVERVERLAEERKTISADITQVMKEAADEGFDKKAIRAVIKVRADPAKTKTEFAMAQLYAEALGITDVFG